MDLVNMDLVNWVGASSVFGLGFLAGRVFQKERNEAIEDGTQELALQLRLVEQMSQFKAGFLARASHELRSPLNGLIGAHQLILSDLCDSPEEAREYVTQAHESALKLLEMLDEVIDISKAQHGTSPLSLQPVALKSILEDVYKMTHIIAENRTIQFGITYPDDNLYVMADPRGLKQALVNLVSSAIAAMQTGFISVDVKISDQVAHLLLEDNRPVEFWRESSDLSEIKSSDKYYTPNFQFLLSQTLLELMQGKLELLAVPNSAVPNSIEQTVTRMQCTLPVIQEDVD